MFESSVNSEGIETLGLILHNLHLFESSVNSEGIETGQPEPLEKSRFESSVNSEGIETFILPDSDTVRLRAV